jgi:hypothetical protein
LHNALQHFSLAKIIQTKNACSGSIDENYTHFESLSAQYPFYMMHVFTLTCLNHLEQHNRSIKIIESIKQSITSYV